MDGRPTWTDCDEAGDFVVPNVLSPRDLVSRPDIMDETVPHFFGSHSSGILVTWPVHLSCASFNRVCMLCIFAFFRTFGQLIEDDEQFN